MSPFFHRRYYCYDTVSRPSSSSVDQAAHPRHRTTSHSTAGLVPPGQFFMFYQSRDQRLCVFEDKDGHLTSVRAARLA